MCLYLVLKPGSPHQVAFSTPYSEGVQHFPSYKPWLDSDDGENILFARQAANPPRSDILLPSL